MARLPASLSCFLISWPANPLGPYRAPSFTGSSPPSDHSRENFSPKCISCGRIRARFSTQHLSPNNVKNSTLRISRCAEETSDRYFESNVLRGTLSDFSLLHRPASLRFAATATSRERPWRLSEQVLSLPRRFRAALKDPPSFETSEALRAIHGYECAVRGI